MKKTLAIFCGIVWVLMSSCSPSENDKLLGMAEQLMEENTDSAWHILCSIDTTLLKQGKERALYNLLLTQAQYKLYIPIKSDSLLDYSEEYYAQHGNDFHMAYTYYYKGAILSELGEKAKAAIYLKKAETHSLKTSNELLKNKIYEKLATFNEQASNNELSLKYNKLFLDSSVLLGDTDLICRACDDLSVVYEWIGQKDSSRFYREKCNKLLPKAKVMVYRYLTNHAAELIQEQNLNISSSTIRSYRYRLKEG